MNTVSEAIMILQEIKGFSLDESLEYFGECVKIKSVEAVLNDIGEMKNKMYLSQHPYRIYEETHRGKIRWRTYVTDNGSRKPITASTREKLEKKLVEYYYGKDKKREHTMETVYPAFLNYKGKETSLANAHKLSWVWDTYYKDQPIVQRSLTEITMPELKEFFLDQIAEKSLNSKKFKEMKSLANMLFDYAIEIGLVRSNTARLVRNISYKKFAPTKRKEAGEQVFVNDEEPEIIKTAISQYNKTGNTAYLGVCLNFTLALRVGEIVALKNADIDLVRSTVHIQRQEIKHYEKDSAGKIFRQGYEIAGFTKSQESDRIIPLTSTAAEIIKTIRKANMANGFSSEFLMLNKSGERMNNDAINNVLRRLNRMVGTSQKANHSIRKTCLSNMNASKLLTDEEIRSFAGHADIATTQKSYIYQTETLDNRIDAYQKAIDAKVERVFKGVQVG
ncbi:MAG: tyrosine-type recombinase/integrase [Lachnospiraceae bacterium]|nr:tyrosine-type recombinase/integrase [Lachnospiraceae bacterium]